MPDGMFRSTNHSGDKRANILLLIAHCVFIGDLRKVVPYEYFPPNVSISIAFHHAYIIFPLTCYINMYESQSICSLTISRPDAYAKH